MEPAFEKYKGIHPGLILERELQKRGLKKGPFAISLHEYPQVINEITKGRRGMTAELSLKIDKALKLERGTMYILQAWYEIDKENQKIISSDHPDFSILRKALFWDTDISKINWRLQNKAVIARVFERGNREEKEEILRFYGREKVKEVIGTDDVDFSIPVMPHLNAG